MCTVMTTLCRIILCVEDYIEEYAFISCLYALYSVVVISTDI